MYVENTDFLPLDNLNFSETNWQQKSNLFATGPLQSSGNNFYLSRSFNTPVLEKPVTSDGFQEMEFQWDFPESVFKKNCQPANFFHFTYERNHTDPLTGDNLTASKTVLEAAVFQAREQLEIFANDEEFLTKMNQAFDNNLSAEEASTLIQDLASGEILLKIEILSPAELNNAHGAFGESIIYLSEKFLSKNIANPEVVASVLLEEIGHYVDRELNSIDSPGDEGNIFAKLVRGETIAQADMTTLKAEDDSAIVFLNGEKLAVEQSKSEVPDKFADKTPGKLAGTTPDYPGYNLIYNSSAPEYNEDPDVVRLWQQRMLDLGYEIEVDGYYGEQSVQVARQFQADNGLEVDGYVGPQTWAASFGSAAQPSKSEYPDKFDGTTPDYPGYNLIYNSSAPEYNEDPDVVRLWQQRMLDLGYEIEVDGYYGEQSVQVARQFQADNGLEVDGYVGPQTWAASFGSAAQPSKSEYPDKFNGSTSSSFGNEIVRIAYQEWETFNRGTIEETEEGAWQRVGDYWQSVGLNYTGQDTGVPWSAAFISWVMQQAGAGDRFEYNASHSYYIEDAVQDRYENDPNAAFFGYRLDEYSPEVGDLVSFARQDGIGYDSPAPYESHSDIVVAKREGEIDVIGGNVDNSVSLKTYAIDSQGRLIDTSHDWIAVLSNQISASSDGSNQPPSKSQFPDKFDNNTPDYPGYNLIYDPSNPNEYDEDPEVVRLWQQRMFDLGYEIEVDGYYGEQSARVARQFQADNGLEVDGYVGPITWAASFSTDPIESTPPPPIQSPNAVDDADADAIEAYQSLYLREFYKEIDILAKRPEVAETTWVMSVAFPGIPGTGAKEMLEENKDFLIEAAERYGIDGSAIAGAIRWEYEVNWKSRLADLVAYNKVQNTGSVDVYAVEVDVPFSDIDIGLQKLNGNGWGKMHYDTAIKVLEASGEEVPDNRTLATMLALPTSAIDLIARSMRQAVDAYWVHAKEDISNKPEILTDLYQSSGYAEKYVDKAKAFAERKAEDPEADPELRENDMGEWVYENRDSLESYRTQGRL